MTVKTLFKAGLLATASLIASAVPAAADPISIALLSTVGFSSAAIGGTLLAATTAGLQVLAGTALSLGLNFLSTTLSEKPKGMGGSRAQVQIGADVPRQIMFGRGATAGSPVYISGRGKKNKYLTIIFRLSDWECDSLESIWVEGDKRTLTSVSVVGTEHSRFIVSGTSDKIVVKFFRGTMTQSADSELIADETGTEGTRIGTWTTNHRLAGICYASVRIEYGEENMPSVPSFVFGLKGAKLYDWRKDSTNGGSGTHRWSDPTTWEWSDNPAVCDYNFRRGFYRNGIRVLGMGVPASDLLNDYYTSAANICDETLTEGGVTEKRYCIGVLVPDDAEWRVAVDAFRASMAGEVVERAGSFGIIAGGAYAPVMTLTDDDMRADAPGSFSRKVPRSELYNAVSVSWANPRIRYENDTLTPLTDATYETEDNSERIVKDVDLSMVYKPYQARRIGKIILEQSRMQAVHVGVYPARFSALEPGDWVTRTFNRDGLGSITMKVVSVREVEPEWYEITLRQAASANFAAPSGTITVADPPIIVQAPLLPGAPATLTVAETVNINADGAILSTITATWAAAENASTYIVAVKQGATEIEYGTGSALTYSFRAVIGVAYQVRVRAVDGDGVKGAWTSYASLTPSGDTTPPGPPSALTATGLFSSVLLAWTNPTDKDFAATEVWEASSNSFSTATKVATVSNTMWSRDGLAPSVTRYYWLKALDRTGNVSAKHPTSDTGGVSATTLTLGSADFPSNLKPIEIVSALPSTGNYQGRTVFLTTDNKLYRFNGSAFVATVPTTDLTGQVSATQISDAAITTAKFAAGIEPIEILAALPSTGNFQGRTVFLTTDNKLYRHNGTSFVSTVPASDLTGQVTTTQITDNSITTAKVAASAITANELSANSVIAGKIAAAAVSTTELAAGAVTAAKIAAGTITATEIAASTITGAKIAADTITAGNIAANAITASELSANSVVAGKIAAAAVTATELAANAVTAAKILAGTITSDKLSVATLSAISADVGTVTAGLIRSGTSGMEVDLTNNRMRSGGFSSTALTGFELDGATGTLTANSVTIAGGTSSRRPFELAFGAVQDGILTDETTANVYLPASLTGSTFGSVYGSIRRTPTETVYNLKVELLSSPSNFATNAVGAGLLQGGFPRSYGIACAPASLLVWSGTPGSYFQNGYLIITKTGEVRFVVSGTDAVVNVNTQSRVLGNLYNTPDADPLFLNSYDQTVVHIWKSVLTGGIRRIRVPNTVTVSGTPTPVAGMRVWMWGAAGQWGSGLRGGPGGYVKFDHTVSPGEMLSLLVGAYNGDGFGGMSPNYVDSSGTRATSEKLPNQGGGGSFLWRGPTRRANLLGVAGGGGSGGKLRIGGSGGSTAFGGGNGETGSEMNVCLGLTSLGDDEYAFGSGGFYANYGASSGGGGYVGGGRLGTANPNNEGGKGGTNYVISTATSVTKSASSEDANGASTVLTPPGTSESVYIANSAYTWGRANAGTAATTQGDAGPGLIAIQWLT